MIRLAPTDRESLRAHELLASGAVPGAGQALLLVDPDASSRARLNRILAAKGFAVTCAASADAALAAAATSGSTMR